MGVAGHVTKKTIIQNETVILSWKKLGCLKWKAIILFEPDPTTNFPRPPE